MRRIKTHKKSLRCDNILTNVIEMHQKRNGLSWSGAVNDLVLLGDHFVRHSNVRNHSECVKNNENVEPSKKRLDNSDPGFNW